jgi:teichuronic acid biosynthesis glycosyltransferase TuaC
VVTGSRISSLLTWLIQPFVKAIISKSPNIEASVYLKHKSFIVPNGVNLEKFKPLPANGASSTEDGKTKVLFLGSKTKAGKNFPLVQAAIAHLGWEDVELVCPYPVSHNDVPGYLNDADVLVFPSFMEGSPNVIKEAMACNCPVVSTDVGDVSWVIGKTKGCFIASFEVADFANKIELAINFSQTCGRTKGRRRIMDLGLDLETVAKRIMAVYKKATNHISQISINKMQISSGKTQKNRTQATRYKPGLMNLILWFLAFGFFLVLVIWVL